MNRKAFLIVMSVLAGGAVIWVWNRAIKRDLMLNQKKRRIWYSGSQEMAYREDEVIFTRENRQVHAFSSRCTHMGCRLEVHPDGQLVCPCHGSAFSIRGKLLRGPAARDLKEIPLNYDQTTERYYVEIEEE